MSEFATAAEIVQFWFEECTPKQWWQKSEQFDRLVAGRFEATVVAAAQEQLTHWPDNAESALARILLLDQFTRNIWRDKKQAFAYDSLALSTAEQAIAKGYDKQYPINQRAFFYMPFMHSESAAVHERAVQLFSQPGLDDNLSFELRHKEIIDRFGRYPHRNQVLGRKSTPEELDFLTQPGSSF
ncbi:DUF924 family protein [Corallincola platygyrae]|uniref:DUF924 family protein n=1 Tax=Corallincola platygyrae TaxID=1193278 RepID=A0ABW4XSA6_9GAMM